MTLINVKTKQDLIKLKKNLIKRAEEEKLKDFNQDANLEKLYKPIFEPLKQIVSETKETKKSIEGINWHTCYFREKTRTTCYQRCSNFLT